MRPVSEFVPLDLEKPKPGEDWGPEKVFLGIMHVSEFFGFGLDPIEVRKACERSYEMDREFEEREKRGFSPADLAIGLQHVQKELESRPDLDKDKILAELKAGLAAMFNAPREETKAEAKKRKTRERVKRHRERQKALQGGNGVTGPI